MPPISCVPKDHFWKKNFYCFSVQTSTIKTYIQQTNHNQQQKQKNKFSPLQQHFLLFVRIQSQVFTHTQSQRKFLVQGTFKIQTKQKSTTFKRSSSHTMKEKHLQKIHVQKKCGESKQKEEQKKSYKHYSFTKKQAFTHIKHSLTPA